MSLGHPGETEIKESAHPPKQQTHGDGVHVKGRRCQPEKAPGGPQLEGSEQQGISYWILTQRVSKHAASAVLGVVVDRVGRVGTQIKCRKKNPQRFMWTPPHQEAKHCPLPRGARHVPPEDSVARGRRSFTEDKLGAQPSPAVKAHTLGEESRWQQTP